MNLRRPAAALLVAFACVAAGCGADNGDQEDVREATLLFFEGTRVPDPALCEILSAELLRVRTGMEGDKAVERCRASAEKADGRVNAAIPTNIEVSDITISGSKATAKVQAAGQQPARVNLVKEDGRWKIEGETSA